MGRTCRKLETHPTTGAAQLVELREVVQEITVPVYVESPEEAPSKPVLFARVSEDNLLRYGVPLEWLEDVKAANEDTLLDLADHLPAEAAEALLELAVGKSPQPSLPAPAGKDPLTHPDAMRRFRVMHNVEELAQALEFPWEKWAIFLHPSQDELVERNYNGPARVSGSAGTGKTVVALHRVAYLTQTNPQARVLLTTFSDALANLLKSKLARLVHRELGTGDAIAVQALDSLGVQLYEASVWTAFYCSARGRGETRSERLRKARAHASPQTSFWRNGSGWLTLGNLKPGKSTATSAAWAATGGCPKPSGRVFGRYSNGSGKGWQPQTL